MFVSILGQYFYHAKMLNIPKYEEILFQTQL